jgi:hypothetical protein
MDEFRQGLGDAWAATAEWLPKLVGFLLILLIGYFVAKAIARVLDSVLERVGFDRAVERGGVGRALSRSKYDASSLMSKVVFYAAMLFVLQLAFGVFGPNPVSDLIKGAIAYLPNVFVAMIILVVGAAIAAGVKEIVEASIGGLSYGRGLALAGSMAILAVAIFAALDQLEIAPAIVTGLFYALLAIIVGVAVISIGVGGIPTMQAYWQRAADRAERESQNIKAASSGASQRIKDRAEARKEQVQAGTQGAGSTTPSRPDEIRVDNETDPSRLRH